MRVRVLELVTNDDGSPEVHSLAVNAALRPMMLNEETGAIVYGEPSR